MQIFFISYSIYSYIQYQINSFLTWFNDIINVKYLHSFFDDRWTKNRSVTDVNWSHRVNIHLIY